MAKFILTGWRYGEPFHSVHDSFEDAKAEMYRLDDSNWLIYESSNITRGTPRSESELLAEATEASTGLINAIKRYRELTRDEYGHPCGLAEAKQKVEDYIVSVHSPSKRSILHSWSDSKVAAGRSGW